MNIATIIVTVVLMNDCIAMIMTVIVVNVHDRVVVIANDVRIVIIMDDNSIVIVMDNHSVMVVMNSRNAVIDNHVTVIANVRNTMIEDARRDVNARAIDNRRGTRNRRCNLRNRRRYLRTHGLGNLHLEERFPPVKTVKI